MASKQFELDGIGTISVVKRASSRSLRLSIRSDGKILVSIPKFASFESGRKFAVSKATWLRDNVKQPVVLQDGQPVGKAHHLQLVATKGITKPRSLVSKTTVLIRFPVTMQAVSPEVQSLARTACIRALKNQASALLPQRLSELALKHGFSYSDVTIKQLKGRWGSCDSQQRIVLNLFLMQLPWQCIDYVLLHELTHTQIMQHGAPFWARMQQLITNLPAIRKQMRSFQPTLQ